MPPPGLQIYLLPPVTPDPKVDRFMPLTCGSLVPINFIFQDIKFRSLVTDEWTDGWRCKNIVSSQSTLVEA